MGTALLSSSGQKVMHNHEDPQLGGAGTDHNGGKEHNDNEKPQSSSGTEAARRYKYTFETLTEYFLQDDPKTVAADFDFMSKNFGLIDRAYESDQTLPEDGRGLTPWQRLEHHISTVNAAARREDEDGGRTRHSSSPRRRYVLFFLGRHGNGYHNIAERYYGGVAWNCYFSTLDGDPEGIMNWSDAHLSKEGRRQAKEVNMFWRSQSSMIGQKMSLPEVYLVSPLDRAMETAEISFNGLGPNGGKLNAIVMEKLREGTGIHTCDRRSDVSYIRNRYPSFNVDVDPHLTNTDEFYDEDRREPEAALAQRLYEFFDELMDSDIVEGKERVSITSHSGSIGAMMRVLGHRQFSLGTGAVIPVLVKIDRVARDQTGAKRDSGRKSKRNGGSAEGAGHKEPTLDLPDLGQDNGEDEGKGTNPNDRSKWDTIPSCPPDLDLGTIGQKRWGMGLREYLDGVENGTIHTEEAAFRFTN